LNFVDGFHCFDEQNICTGLCIIMGALDGCFETVNCTGIRSSNNQQVRIFASIDSGVYFQQVYSSCLPHCSLITNGQETFASWPICLPGRLFISKIYTVALLKMFGGVSLIWLEQRH
jgi:hypothetical protein